MGRSRIPFKLVKPLTDEDRAYILRTADVGAGGGLCVANAVILNRLLFQREGRYIAAVNWPLWLQRRNFVGHIGVEYANNIWDTEAVYDTQDADDVEEFRAWGMLDPYDWGFDGDDEAAEDARIFYPSRNEMRSIMRRMAQPAHCAYVQTRLVAVMLDKGYLK